MLKKINDYMTKHDLLILLFMIVIVLFFGCCSSVTYADVNTGTTMYNKLTDEQKKGYDNVLIIQDYSNNNVYRYFLYNGKLTLTPSTTWSGCYDYQFSNDYQMYRSFSDGTLGSENVSNPAYSTKSICVYSNQAIFDNNGTKVFQLPPKMGEIVQMKELKLTTVLSSIKLLIPLLIVLIASWIGLRKCWNFLRVVLKAS